MQDLEPTVPQWVCEHCFIHLVNGDCTEPDNCHPAVRCWPLHPEVLHPLYLLRSMQVTPGMTQEYHSCGREDDAYFGECDCERIEFSTSSCDGCGTPYHGSREAVTGWVKAA